MTHAFILQPGRWEGKGTITFTMAEDVLNFTMTWTVLPEDNGRIHFSQEIDIDTFAEKMHNHFYAEKVTPSSFEIILENNIAGKVLGKGVIDAKVVAWEFARKDQEFEGFEVYELQGDGSYNMRAEFTAGDGLRTKVKGSIEKK